MNGKIAVRYQPIWGRIYIVLAVLCAVIFLVGGYILSDPKIYLDIILCVVIFYIGYGMIRRPYAEYNEKEIIQYSFWGGIRRKYEFSSPEDLLVKNNHLYLNGKKLKMNSWFLQKADWQRMLSFFGQERSADDELVDG